MDYLILLVYPVLAVLLFGKCKLYSNGEFNDDYLSRDSMKALQGFAAVAIMVHHVAQKTCAYGILEEYYRGGLEPFLNIGFLLVALFFFCSGYGLSISEKTNVNYMDDFIKRRVVPLIIPFVLSNIIFVSLEAARGIDGNFGFFANTYSWFVIVIFILYLLFWLIYRTYMKSVLKFVLLTISVICFILISYNLGNGEWWINSVPAFLVGVLYARFNLKITAFIRKYYGVALVSSIALFSVTYFLSNYVYKEFWGVDLYVFPMIKVVLQMLCSSFFVITVFIITMKIKVGNPVLRFLGKYTLELYLFHVVFVELFAYCFIFPSCKPYYWISNSMLYLLAVVVLTIPVAMLINYINKAIVKLVYLINVDIFEFKGPYYIRFVVVILVAAVLLTIGNAYNNTNEVKAAKEAYESFITENDIKLIDVGEGNTVAASILGEGNTIVLLDFSDFTSPIFYYKKLAKDLSEQYRVVTLETPGFGFAGKASTKQTIDTIVDEIHTALDSLGIKEDYVLFARNEGALIIDRYMESFDSEVSEIITLDSSTLSQYTGIVDATGSFWDGYWNGSYRRIKLQNFQINTFRVCGYIAWYWESFSVYLEYLYFNESEIEAMHYIYVNQYYSNEFVELYKDIPFYFDESANGPYPENRKVTMIVSGYMVDTMRRSFGLDWEMLHNEMVSNPDNQSAVYMYGTSDSPMRDHKKLADLMMEVLGE